jgi:hypothetical protein
MNMSTKWSRALCGVGLLLVGFAAGRGWNPEGVALAQTGGRVFELRTYTANEGKLDALQKRFREHTTRLFSKHGMTNIGYWTPQEGPLSQNTLIYILAHSSREAAKKSWSDFQADPEWQKARAESELQGRILSNVTSVFLTPTDYSPMK